jgi:uncharacterized protein YdiU (UPF0061 family)
MLNFDNRFVRELPGDSEQGKQPRQVFGACWSPVAPTPVAAPTLLAHSREVAADLDLDEQDMASSAMLGALSGNRLLPGMLGYASCYGGHQFGHWAGQLGDGRAILLGETVNRRGQRFELQLKGAGPTPYARRADGRAVLRSSIREFLCSEAMHHLGVPTTRALSLVGSGENVVRDMFYDGHPIAEPGADCLPSGAFVHPLRAFRAARCARRARPAAAPGRLHHCPRLPRAGGARPNKSSARGSAKSASAPPA